MPPADGVLPTRCSRRSRSLPGSDRPRSRPTAPLGRRAALLGIRGRRAVEQPPPEVVQDAVVFRTTPDYFRTFAIPLVRGPAVHGRDRTTRAPVALVSEALAERYWPGRSPLGARITFGDPGTAPPSG